MHEYIEVLVDVKGRCRDLERYRDLIALMGGWWFALEDELATFDWSVCGLDFEARRKGEKLRRDLRCLDVEAIAPPPEALPHLRCLADAFGSLYVMEGSTLGGQVIRRELAEILGVDEHSGAAFYAGYGSQTGPMWKRFLDALERWCSTPERRDAAARAAYDTFASLGRCLRPSSGGPNVEHDVGSSTSSTR